MTLEQELQHRADMVEIRAFLRERQQAVRELNRRTRANGYPENLLLKVLATDILNDLPCGVMEILEDATDTSEDAARSREEAVGDLALDAQGNHD